MTSTLESHMSVMAQLGRLTNGRINGVQSRGTKPKRMGVQGVAGTKTGSGSNKPAIGNGGKSRGASSAQPVLPTKLPKVVAPNLAAPKRTSAFIRAFEAAKQSLQISTDSRAAKGGAKAKKGSTASSVGAGID